MKLLRLLIAVFCLHASAPADVTKGNFGAARPEDSQRKVEANPEQKEKRTTYPFYGTLDSVNSSEKTITLKGKKKNRIILFTSDTRIQKGNTKAKITDGVPGERVSGSVKKTADGKEEAVTIRFGPKNTGS